MSIPSLKESCVYSHHDSYYAQKSPEDWEGLRDLAMQSGGYLADIEIMNNCMRADIYHEIVDRIRKKYVSR